MQYNFDEIIDRHNTNSYKWDGCDNKEMLPMWVADMDFKTAPCVIEALEKRVKHGIFGYAMAPDEYYEAIINWFKLRHNFEIKKESIVYTIGVVPAVSVCIKAICEKGDKVLIQTPVYNCFYSSIRNCECTFAGNALSYDGNGHYSIDFEDLENKASDPKVKMMLLCNPHNPSGRVFTADELRKIGEICNKHNLIVVSDEIHCEFVHHDHVYTPFALACPQLRDKIVTLTAPSKAFNLAGLQTANIIVDNEELRKKINRVINIFEVCDIGPLGITALIAAYSEEGGKYLDALNAYLEENFKIFKEFFNRNLPQFKVTELEGSYLAWVDCSCLNKDSKQIEEELKKEVNLWLNAGRHYGIEGKNFMRFNLACPKARLLDGLERFKKYVIKTINY